MRAEVLVREELLRKPAPRLTVRPELPLRHSTAGRRVRSDTLCVGSTPSTRANIHSAASGSNSTTWRRQGRLWRTSVLGNGC